MGLLQLIGFEPEKIVSRSTIPENDSSGQTRVFHISGPVVTDLHPEGRPDKAILGRNNHMVITAGRGIVTPEGMVYGDEHVYRGIARDYLEGRISADVVTAVNPTIFLLPLDRKYWNALCRRIWYFEDLEVRGKHLPRVTGERTHTDEKGKLVDHFADIVLWKLDDPECSDYVSIEVIEKEKLTKRGMRKRIEVKRFWSRASNKDTGVYTPYNAGKETVVATGYEPK